MNYKLTLTTADGEVLRQWVLGEDEDNDFPFPLTKLAPLQLSQEINSDIRRCEEAGPEKPRKRKKPAASGFEIEFPKEEESKK